MYTHNAPTYADTHTPIHTGTHSHILRADAYILTLTHMYSGKGTPHGSMYLAPTSGSTPCGLGHFKRSLKEPWPMQAHQPPAGPQAWPTPLFGVSSLGLAPHPSWELVFDLFIQLCKRQEPAQRGQISALGRELHSADLKAKQKQNKMEQKTLYSVFLSKNLPGADIHLQSFGEHSQISGVKGSLKMQN